MKPKSRCVDCEGSYCEDCPLIEGDSNNDKDIRATPAPGDERGGTLANYIDTNDTVTCYYCGTLLTQQDRYQSLEGGMGVTTCLSCYLK